ncbi:MAG: hypothetical protein C0478_05270 [Planctomyces sp.]|nr:hypothetical protein [Planctomyces sp.]
MSWPGFASLSAAWFLLLLAPLVIFYFLKLRRPRVEVSSLALWRQVISDSRVNSPFQKFQRNLLLLAQILLLLALVIAAMQPFWPASAQTARYLPVIIDVSASMEGVDRAGAVTRLELAKQEARKLIDGLMSDQQLSLIAASDSARRLTDFTNDQRVLRAALDQLTIAEATSKLEDAFRMAIALSRTVPVETVVLLSDGNVPPQLDLELPFRVSFQKLPAATANVGITEFNARRSRGAWDVFARVEASSGYTGLTQVEFFENGELRSSESLSLAPGAAERLVFRTTSAEITEVTLRLVPDSLDALASDNEAFLVTPQVRPLVVYCPPTMTTFRHALAAMGDTAIFPTESTPTPSSIDLVISDQLADAERDARVVVTVALLPADLEPLVLAGGDAEGSGLAEVTDWMRTDPLLRHVQLLDVQIGGAPVLKEGQSDRSVEAAGYQVVATAANGPLIVSRNAGGQIRYHILFPTDRSTLPFRVGFPILVANAVDLAMNLAGLNETKALRTGVLPPIALKPDTRYRIVGPVARELTAPANGELKLAKPATSASRSVATRTTEITTDEQGQLSGVAAPAVGTYQIFEGTTLVRQVGVALQSLQETSLFVQGDLRFAEAKVSAAEEKLSVETPLWRWFAWAALAFLLWEWWLFQKPPIPAKAQVAPR